MTLSSRRRDSHRYFRSGSALGVLPVLLVATAVVTACAGTGGFDLGSLIGGSLGPALDKPLSQKVVDRAEAYDTQMRENDAKFLPDHSRKVRILQRITDRMVARSLRPDWRVTVRVVDDPTDNAFTTGGRYIYLNKGLVDRARSQDELAFVIGHEIGHIHGAHVERGARVRTAVSAAQMLGVLLAGKLDSEQADFAASLFARYGGLIPPKFSRAHETEADVLGVSYAAGAGFDPDRGRDFFVRQTNGFAAAELQLQQEKKALDRELSAAEGNLLKAKMNRMLKDTPQARSEETQAKMLRDATREKIRLARLHLAEAELRMRWSATHPPAPDRIENIDAVAAWADRGEMPPPGAVRTAVEAVVAARATRPDVASGPRARPRPVGDPALRRAQQRLNARGYQCGAPDGIMGRQTRVCLEGFQASEGLDASGRLDEPTRQRLGL